MGVKVRLILAIGLILFGMTQVWCQSNEPSSTNSNELSAVWLKLSTQFEGTLDQLEQTLGRLSQRQTTLESSGELLSFLCKELSRQNNDLKRYNAQITVRLQERDEDLMRAYDRLDKADRRASMLTKILVGVGALLLVLIVIAVKWGV